MSVIYFPPLETEHLVMRNVHDGDIDFIFKRFSDQTICRYLLDEEHDCVRCVY